MKLSRFITSVILITFLSLFYVWQQTEILRLAYTRQKKTVYFEDLLDKNGILQYNINKSASLVRIGNKIPKNIEFQIPGNFRLVKFAAVGRNSKISAHPFRKRGLLYSLFGIKRQAEAKTIKP